MQADSTTSQGIFFAVSLQEHKFLGVAFTAHIVKLLSKDGGIYTVADNVFPENLTKWKSYVPELGETIVKTIDEMSDSHLFKSIGKRYKTLAHFYEAVQADVSFGDYVRAYYERRLTKCFDLIVKGGIPLFLKDKKFNNLYHDNLLSVSPDFAQPIFKFSVSPSETRYSLKAVLNDESVKLQNRNAQVLCNAPAIIRLGNRVLRFDSIEAKKLAPFFTKDYVSIPKSTEKKYFETFVLNSIREQMVEVEGFTIANDNRAKQAILSLEPKLNGSLCLFLYFRYGDKRYLSHSKPQAEVRLEIKNNEYHFTRFSRDLSWEEKVKESIRAIGLTIQQGSEFAPSSVQSDYHIIEWVNRNEQGLMQLGFSIEQQVQGISYYLKQFNLDIKGKLNNDWFDIYGMVKLNNFEFPFILLRKNILKGIREYVLPNGEVFIIPEEWFAKYKSLMMVGKSEDDRLTVNRSCFGFIQEAEVECQEAVELKTRFSSLAPSAQIAVPEGLNAKLRGYQKLGLMWLQLLNESGIGGCLADDMGLGKTVQTLAMLLYDMEKRNGNGHPILTNGIAQMGHTSLLVVPTSLLFNWQREVKRFAPSLSVYQFTGPNRTRSITKLINYNIVLTTYGVLRNDIDLLKDVRFNYVVLDESQTIKNPSSKVYRSAVLLKAKHFLTLSGTPIENSLTDLWAQLNFLNRGMLGSLRTFRAEYIQPIEQKNEERISKLKELVQPFILRRTKKEVAPELPQLNEQVVFCNLSEEQKRIYESEKSAIRNQIIENIDSLGYPQSAISILRGLTRLRQIANHPKMLDEFESADSGKFDEVSRTIETLVEENHKILVFSSFVKHLRIIEKQLLQLGIGYQMLIGSTTNRQQIVDRFQNDTSSNVFLISIKAGGVGLNLTAADYILVLDPWWNPAVESQAIARAHRIGQDKRVFVYKFISVDTVEEKIQRLQEQKLLLSTQFVDNANPLSIINREQMMEILS